MDRIDIHLELSALKASELLCAPAGEPSDTIRQRTEAARERQLKRFTQTRVFANAQMNQKQIKKFCALTNDGERLLKQAISELGLSARAHDKVLKLARTISDLASSEDIRCEHLAEAISYRTLDKISL